MPPETNPGPYRAHSLARYYKMNKYILTLAIGMNLRVMKMEIRRNIGILLISSLCSWLSGIILYKRENIVTHVRMKHNCYQEAINLLLYA
jgi:hypothetical protein